MKKLLSTTVALGKRLLSATPVLGPYSTAVNISVDLIAFRDDRPEAWGGAASFASKVEFHPPTGYRTRIVRVYGDFIGWPKSGEITGDQRLEIGFGLKTTAPDGSVRVTYPGYAATPYDNSFVWVQDGLDANNSLRRIPIDYNTSAGGLLEADNILLAQSFIAIDTTGLLIHMEPTIVVVYQFEVL
jgi:hypothetical protein